MTKAKSYKNSGSAALPVYPIRTVARLSGISEGTLRAWEARYGLIKPARTKGGHRLFSKNDINRINEIKKLLHEDGLGMAGIQVVMADRREAGNG